MHPKLIEIGPISLNSYGVMIATGFMLSLFFLVRRARRVGVKPMDIFDTAIFVLLCGIVGARLLHIVLYWDERYLRAWQKLQELHQGGSITAMDKYLDFFVRLIAVWKGGLAFFGGFLGAMAGLAYSLRKRALPLRTTLDIFAGVLPLGHAFGRIGCFLAGCCYGRVTDTFFGVCFPPGSQAYEGHLASPPPEQLPVESPALHPTQLYAAGYNIIIFGLLTWVCDLLRRGPIHERVLPRGYGRRAGAVHHLPVRQRRRGIIRRLHAGAQPAQGPGTHT
jgi:phosphatidylglycerol:prolipoprotein diacylglycerol transferase